MNFEKKKKGGNWIVESFCSSDRILVIDILDFKVLINY